MLLEMKLVVTQNNKVLKTVTNKASEENFVQAIKTFQTVANDTLTKLIEDAGDTGDTLMEEDDGTESEDENIICNSPKKRKK